MHKTTMVVNDRKVARAKKILGTRGIRDTYDAALDHVLAADRRARAIDTFLKGLDHRRLLRARDEAWR